MEIGNKLLILGVFAILASASVHADTVYSSLNQAEGSIGAINPGNAYGDEVSLNAPGAIIEGMTLSFDWVVDSNKGPSSFEVSFFHVSPGSDSMYQTRDDTIGGMIGTPFTETDVTIAPDTPHTIDFGAISYEVPQNFVWRVKNGDFIYALNSTADTQMTGGTANPDIMWWDVWDGSEPTEGNTPYYGTEYGDLNPSMEFHGVATPEPGTTALALLAAGAGVFAVWRRRK